MVMVAGCGPTPASPAVVDSPIPTQVAALAVVPTKTAIPTPRLLVTATAPATVTPNPTVTLAPTVAATVTAVPPDPAAGLPCPAESPAKPTYLRGVVGSEPWPNPDPSRTAPHLWLASPVEVDPPPRVNRAYPYGSDSNGRYLLHNGLDFVEPPGTAVLAVADGTVIVAGPDAERQFGWRCDWYGNLVVLELDQTWDGQPVYVLFGHVLEISVEPGQRVRKGEPLAAIGVGGVATAPHLHVEVRVGANEFGATRNPALWFVPSPDQGVIAGRLLDPDGRPWQGMTITLIDPTGQSAFEYTWTYLDDPEHLIAPDEAHAENFAFEGISPGEYDVYALVQGAEYRQRVTVNAGKVTQVELTTAPYMTPTPGPVPSATP